MYSDLLRLWEEITLCREGSDIAGPEGMAFATTSSLHLKLPDVWDRERGWQGADEASRVVCVEVEAHEVADVGQCGVDGVGEGQVVREVLLPVGVAGEEA